MFCSRFVEDYGDYLTMLIVGGPCEGLASRILSGELGSMLVFTFEVKTCGRLVSYSFW